MVKKKLFWSYFFFRYFFFFPLQLGLTASLKQSKMEVLPSISFIFLNLNFSVQNFLAVVP